MADTGLVRIKKESSVGGQELVCVLVRKDAMAPIWRGICIGFRGKTPLSVTTMDRNSHKGNQDGMIVLRAASNHQDRSTSSIIEESKSENNRKE